MGVDIDQTISWALGSTYRDDLIWFSHRLLLLFSSHFAVKKLGEWVPKANRNWILGPLLPGPVSLGLTLPSPRGKWKHLPNLVTGRIKFSSEGNQAHTRPSTHTSSVVVTHILWGLLSPLGCHVVCQTSFLYHRPSTQMWSTLNCHISLTAPLIRDHHSQTFPFEAAGHGGLAFPLCLGHFCYFFPQTRYINIQRTLAFRCPTI